MPTTRMFSACPREVSGKPLLPEGKKQNLGVWVMWKAQHLGTSFCPGFPSALYWRQTFTKKGEKKGVLRENDFLWQEYYLIFWPLKVFLVRTQIPCVIVQLTYYYIDTLFILYQIDFKSTALKINWWLFFFIKFCVWHLHSFQNVSVHQKCHYSECLFSAALVWLPFNIVHTLYLCFTVMSNKNVDFIFCTKCPMYRIKKKFIETAKIGKWHNYFSLENICNFML